LWVLLFVVLGTVAHGQDKVYGQGREPGDALFQRVVRIQLDSPPESLAVLRSYQQVWRQARP
jgi:hypothetical protein